MSAYSYFNHALGRFPGKLDLILIPKPDTPAPIKADGIIFSKSTLQEISWYRCQKPCFSLGTGCFIYTLSFLEKPY